MIDPEPRIQLDKKEKEPATTSLLRDTSAHYIRLIGDADRKARIMIVTNSILLTISVTLLTRALDHPQPYWIAAGSLLVSNLLALFFSIISVKPELHSRADKEIENNMLHYKKCNQFSLSDYKYELLTALNTREQKIDAMVKYMYFFGNLLNNKYRLLKIAYRVFYWGIVAAVVAYLAIILINRPASGLF